MGAPVDPIAAGRSEGELRTQVDALGRHVVSMATVPVPPVVTALVGRPAVIELCLPERRRRPACASSSTLEDGTARRPTTGPDELRDDRRLRGRRSALGPAGGAHRAGPRPCAVREPARRVPLAWPSSMAGTATGPRCSSHPPTCVSRPQPSGCGARSRPLYALRADRGLGPNLGDLDELATWLDRHGGKIAGHAALARQLARSPTHPARPLSTPAPTRRCRAGSGTSSTSTSSGCPSWPASPAARGLARRPDDHRRARRACATRPAFDAGAPGRPDRPACSTS